MFALLVVMHVSHALPLIQLPAQESTVTFLTLLMVYLGTPAALGVVTAVLLKGFPWFANRSPDTKRYLALIITNVLGFAVFALANYLKGQGSDIVPVIDPVLSWVWPVLTYVVSQYAHAKLNDGTSGPVG